MRETTKVHTGGSKTTIVGGSITKTTRRNHTMWATDGDITFTSAKTISMKGEESGITYGDYVPPEEVYITHPKVEKVEFFDENNILLNQNTKDFWYGKKLKIKVSTKDAKDGEMIYITLQGKTKSKNQKFDLMDGSGYRWGFVPLKDNHYTTPLFELNPNWYSDDFEYYDYDEHTTKIKEEDLNEFFVKVSCDAKTVYYPLAGERLKPIAYKRNYEELIGLFSTDNTGEKDLLTNYENKFIDSVKDFKNIVDDFSEYIHEDNRDLKIGQIQSEVLVASKKLWDEAIWQVQGHDLTTKSKDLKTGEEKTVVTKVPALLDDRPLYWARIAMQVILKRHPIFINDIDLEKSIVKKGTELDKIIQLFEEKSRNYTGIDFSKAGSKKKVLITGFDPFVLNQFKFKGAKVDTQNPSGISALFFHGKTIGNAYVQCVIVPVRYEDFDNEIIENLVQENINQFDIMMTMSRNDNNFDLERFACKFRGAYYDNMGIGNSQLYLGDNSWDYSRFEQIPNGNEFYETTLPIGKILTGDLDASKNIVFFDQSIIDDKGFKENHPIQNGNSNNIVENFPFASVKGKSTFDSGSGGDYLSNEIMYRATRKRDDMGMHNIKAVGHVHISSELNSEKYIDIIKKIVDNATK